MHGCNRGLAALRRQSRIRKEPVVAESITFVGLDAHKNSIAVAMLLPGEKRPIEWQISNTPGEIKKLSRKLKRGAPGEIRSCYEAGPTGYGLQRALEADQIVCEVVAPSLIPVKPGDRIKTDRRDAKKLAELLRADLLTEVHAPTPEEESIRDLSRCREDAKQDQTRARHRLGKFLLRRSIVYSPGKAWTTLHCRWLATIKFESEIDQTILGNYLHALELIDERLKALEAKMEEVSIREPYAAPTGWLRCYYGIDTISAMTIVSELYDIRRFQSARALMAYLGLVPSEHSSGDKKNRGSITKTGNGHVRRILIEAAHHYRHRPRVGPKLQKRRAGQPMEAITIADRAHARLHRRYWRLMGKGKPTNKAKTAVARELAGFIWSSLTACVSAKERSSSKALQTRLVGRRCDVVRETKDLRQRGHFCGVR